MAPSPGTRGLYELYLGLRPRYMDLLHDMGHAEAFLIDGESLVAEVLCFCRSRSQILGGQALAVAFYAERMLQQLLERGGRFTVVFYTAMEPAWQQQPAAYALRQMLIAHLQLVQQHLMDTTAAAGFAVQLLQDFWSPAWHQYMTGLKPRFVMVTDIFLDALGPAVPDTAGSMGSSSAAGSSGNAAGRELQQAAVAAAPLPVQELLLLQSLQYLAVTGLDLVYLGQLQFDSLTAMGFLVGARKTYRHIKTQAAALVAAKQLLLGALVGDEAAAACCASADPKAPADATPVNAASPAEDAAPVAAASGLAAVLPVSCCTDSTLRMLLPQLSLLLGSSRLAAAVLGCWQVLSRDSSPSTAPLAGYVTHMCTHAAGNSGSSCMEHCSEVLLPGSSGSNPSARSQGCCSDCWYAAVYLLHAVLLQQLPLHVRAQPVPAWLSACITNSSSSPQAHAMGVPPTATSFSEQLLLSLGSILQQLHAAAISRTSRSSTNACSATGGVRQQAGAQGQLHLQQLARETADAWDGHLFCWLLLSMRGASPSTLGLLPVGGDGSSAGSKAGGMPPAAGSATVPLTAGLLSGLGAAAAESLAAAFACLAKLLRLQPTQNSSNCIAEQLSFPCSGRLTDEAAATAGLSALEAVLLGSVPPDLRDWATSLAVQGPSTGLGLQPVSAAAAGVVGSQGPELLASMKAQKNLLARIFGVQPDATPSAAEVQQGAVLTGGTNDSITPSGSSSSSSGSSSSSSSSGGDVGGCVLGDAPGSLFGIEVFEEKHHWHINKELEPAFWTQAKDDRARLNRKKQEWAALPARKLARFRNLPDALREQLSELLGQAESGPPAEYARLEAQVKDKALRALEGQLFRPLQMERRALEKMVKSLQGGTTFYRTTAVASATPAASAGALPASTDTGINPSTNKGTRGGAGKPKVSKKDAIIAEQTAKKLKEKQEAAQTVWDAADGPAQQAAAALKAADAAASSSRASAASLNAAAGACGAAVAAVDAAARKLHISLSSSSLVAQAAVTKLALLHARLVCQAAAAAQRGASGISTASSSSEWRSTLQQLLLAVSAAANLSPTLQLLAVPLPKSALTVSSKHTVAAPIQAAAAAVAALGYSAEASALLQAAGFDSGSITYKTSKPFAFKPLAESPAGPARAVSITEGPDDSHSTHCVREGPGEGSRILPSWVRLQLELLPHHLRRQSSGAPDPRITGFVPDEWQQQLLDVVDKGSCAVVTAPTSSGKTFISSYVIQQVLKPEASAAAAAAAVGPSGTTDSSRSSNNGKLDRGLSKGSKDVAGADQSGQQLATVAAAACAGPTSEGVVVIVLPTKALVNQLAAQVYNDFGPGVHGVFTRDYRMTPQTCRVLLTVPACLEILMLSPANRNWVESVRWVIFDEVHCISELGGGDIWERLLLAVRCPWLALSATVGNPEAFRAWLQRVKDAQLAADMAAGLVPAAAAAGTCSGGKVIANGSSGSMSDGFRPPRYQVHLIQHKERYNELLAQVFVPQHNSPRPRSPAGQCGTATGAPAATQQCGWGAATGAPAATQHHSGSTRRQTSQISGPIWTLSSSRNSAAAVAASKSSAAAGASSGPHSSSGKGRLVALHPAASVSLQQLAAPAAAGGGWPCELPLAPDEALQLYDALLASVKALYRQQTQQGADQENATNEQAGGSADEGVLAEMQLQLQQLAPERMQVLPEVFPVPVSVVSGGTTQSNSGSKKKGSSQVSSSSSAAIPTAAAAAAAMAAGQTAGRPSEVFLSKPAAKAWAAQLVQLLEQWARAEPGTPAATSSTCDLAADTSSTRQLGALVVPGNAASTPAATSEALSTGDPAASLAASVVAMALQRLGSASATAMAADEAAWQQQHPTEPCFDWAYQRQHLLDLILSLRQAGELPAILFNFERGLCMAYAGLLCDALGDAEGRWREQHARELQAERAKLDFGDRSADGGHDDHSSSSGGRSRQRGKAAGGADGGGAGGSSSSSGVDLRTVAVGGVVASADEELPDPSFTLLSYDKARSQDLWDTIADLRADGTDPDLLQALARGIGVHHSGLDTRYRQAVEMLFRSKHLQVVVATGTLAYGIHMPCRAVVMAGDSPFLDALNFRQMSGRAGRRGLDNVGHVVFFSLPKHRIDALRVSQLPRLRGTMLPNPCLLLRMLLLHQQLSSRHADKTKGATGRGLLQLQPVAATSGPTGYQLSSATSSLLTLAAEPFLAAADPTARQQLEHMMEFGLVYLAASHLIDAAGRPVGLAGLVSHLFWTDPANFALARLLSSGAVHRLVAECKGQQQVQEALLLVVAGLFERLPLHPLEAQRWLGSKRNESPSVVVLPSLPASVSAIIEQHNDHVLQLLVSTLKQRMTPPTAAVCSPGSSNCGQTLDPNLLYQQECSLPLSGCRYAITPHSDGTGGSPSTIRQRLAASAVPAVVASPFMALCGAGDEFGSLSELLLAGRQGLRLHRNGVPLMAVQDRRGRQLDMNAWAWDYFKHGSKSELVRANGMLEGDAWARLKSFSGVLAAISTSLQQATLAGDTQSAAAGGIDPGSNMSVADAFSSLAEAFNMRFRGFNTGGVVVQHGAAHVGRQR